MKRRTAITFIAALILTAAAAAAAYSTTTLVAALAAAGLFVGAAAMLLCRLDATSEQRETLARIARDEKDHAARAAASERRVRDLETEIGRMRAEAESVGKARTGLAEAIGLVRETAPIIDGLARKAIEKSEHGSTSLTDDIYEIGQQSTSLSRSIEGFLRDMSSGEDSLERSMGDLTEDVVRLNDVAGLYDRANTSLDESIGRVSRSVGETSDLIGKVSDIAEQTSILAINAAIYAAKAGEFGSGFSVIASEIQKLASTSKEVAETIGANNQTIERQVGEFSNAHRSLIAESRVSLSETITSIERTIIGLKPKVERVAASIQTAAGVSRSVTDHLNEINMAMQEQDAIQQIVAHIADILRESLEHVPVVDRITTGGDGRSLRELARQLAARHFTMKDEFAAVGDDGYGAIAPATAVLEDGTELRGDVTLF